MRILVLGAGGVGGYFGGRLAAAGLDVTFLVRAQRAELLAHQGLSINSPLGDVHTPVQTITEAETTYDTVLLACKAYNLDAAINAIAPAVGTDTLVVPLLNGIRHLEDLDERFGADRVLGGLCHIGATLNDGGGIDHLNSLQRFVLGPRTPEQTQKAQDLHLVLTRGGFAPILSEDILQEMWEKFVFLTAYAGMTTLTRAPIGAILAADEGEAITCEMLEECVATATRSGYAPGDAAMSEMTTTLTERGSNGTTSMLRDMARNAATEHEHIIGDMLARARKAQVSAPLLRVSLANVQAYEAIRSTTDYE